MDIKELKGKLTAVLTAARDMAAVAEKAERDFTDDERQKVAALIKEAADLKASIKQAEGDADLHRQLDELGALGVSGGQQNGGMAGKGKSIGEQFVSAPAYQAWLKQVAPGGQISDRAHGLNSPPVEFRSLFGRKTLVTGADDAQAGAFVETDYTGIYEPLGRAPLTLRGLISQRTTQSDLVSFVRQVTRITQAGGVAEATATGGSSGTKPEAALEFEQVDESVKTIATWIPATKRALSDAAQLRGLIDGELRSDLEEELEEQLVNGAGGADLTGILNTPGVLTQAWNIDILTTMRQAKTTARVSGRVTPTAWLLNPEDWETIELEQDKQGRFYGAGPFATTQPTVWGIPVVECETIAAGTGLLGDFRKAVLWDRERATISISESHSDFFVRNMVAILAEMRAAFGVIRPSSFVVVDLAAGS